MFYQTKCQKLFSCALPKCFGFCTATKQPIKILDWGAQTVNWFATVTSNFYCNLDKLGKNGNNFCRNTTWTTFWNIARPQTPSKVGGTHADRKQNINKFCFFKNVLTKQSDMFYQTDFFLCQINAIAKKQQFSSAKVSSIFRKRRHITFTQVRNEQINNYLVNATKDRGV